MTQNENWRLKIANFIKTELSCDGQYINNSLIIKGKYKPKIFESVISKFVKTYLKCFSCSSFKCYLLKENSKYAFLLLNNIISISLTGIGMESVMKIKILIYLEWM